MGAVTATKKTRAVSMALALLMVLAVLGYLLPLLSIDVELFVVDYHKKISAGNLVSFFSEKSQLGDTLLKTDLLNLVDAQGHLTASAKLLIAACVAYFLTLLLALLLLALALADKLRRLRAALAVVGLALMIFAGLVVADKTTALFQSASEKLGIIGQIIDITALVQIQLGGGFWLTAGCLAAAALLAGGQLLFKPRR